MALGGNAIKTIECNRLPLPPSKVTEALYFDNEALQRLWRFQKRTVLSIGNLKGSRVFQNISLELAFSVRAPHLSLN